ncbi:MAG TPA: PAS domain-containing protein [Azospirillaceae bacterium]|nr:PAS domain-containing protein [Azospirillaceae bacterium]
MTTLPQDEAPRPADGPWERDPAGALRDSEDRLRIALEATGLGTWDVDPRSRRHVWDARCREILGIGPDEPITAEGFLARVHPDDRPAVQEATRRALDPAGGGDYSVEYRLAHPAGEERWVAARGRAFFEEGRPIRYIGTVLDITERKRAEQRQRLLMAEVDHRAKNMLAVVQAVLRLTRAGDVPSFVDIAQGRIGALARAHTLLARSRWEGTPLRELAREEVEATARGLPVAVEGPEVALAADASQAVATILHELLTNAVRHGALSAPGGRVALRWTAGPEGLALSWREEGGPEPVPPARPGFGLVLVEQSVRHQLAGRVALDWRPQGLAAEIALPAPVLARPAAPSPASPLAGRRVAVAAGTALAGLERAAALAALGAAVEGPFTAAAELAAALSGAPPDAGLPDAALLDWSLRDGTVLEAARRLSAAGVPVVLVGGGDAAADLPGVRLADLPVPRDLSALVAQAVVGRRTDV